MNGRITRSRKELWKEIVLLLRWPRQCNRQFRHSVRCLIFKKSLFAFTQQITESIWNIGAVLGAISICIQPLLAGQQSAEVIKRESQSGQCARFTEHKIHSSIIFCRFSLHVQFRATIQCTPTVANFRMRIFVKGFLSQICVQLNYK